jgi:hypothetical protein
VGSVQIPLVLDIDNTFRKENALLIDQHGETTVLTDAHNRILLTGNPIESKEDKEKFFQKIHDSQ